MPRPRDTSPLAAGAGAALGAILAGPAGAAVGGLLGAGAGTEAVPLEEALRRELRNHGLTFENLRRAARFEVHVLCSDRQRRIWPVVGRVSADRSYTPDQLDDALFDAVVQAIPASLG